MTLNELKASSYKNFDLIVSDLKNAFMRDFTTERACRYAGLSTSQYYEWINKSDEFAMEMEKAKDYLMNQADQIIVDEIVTKKNSDVAKWFKERRDKARFSIRQEVTGKDGENMKLDLELTDDERQDLLAASTEEIS